MSINLLNNRPPTQMIIAHIENILLQLGDQFCELSQCYKVLSVQGLQFYSCVINS